MQTLTFPQAYWISLFSEIKSCLANHTKKFAFLKDGLFEQSLLNDKTKWITPIKVNRKGIKRKGKEYSTITPSTHIKLKLIHDGQPIIGSDMTDKHRLKPEVMVEIREWLQTNLPETDEECIRQIKEVIQDGNWIDNQLRYLKDLNERRPDLVEALMKSLTESWNTFIQCKVPLSLKWSIYANNLLNIHYYLFNQVVDDKFEYQVSNVRMGLKKWRTISLFNSSRSRRREKLYDAVIDLPDEVTKLPNWKDVPNRKYRPFFITEMQYRNRERIPRELLSNVTFVSVFPIPERTIKAFIELEREKVMKSIEYKEVDIDEAVKNIDISLPF